MADPMRAMAEQAAQAIVRHREYESVADFPVFVADAIERVARAAVEAEQARQHKWTQRDGLFCCDKCGIVLRADGNNAPCPGVAHIRARGGR